MGPEFPKFIDKERRDTEIYAHSFGEWMRLNTYVMDGELFMYPPTPAKPFPVWERITVDQALIKFKISESLKK